MGIWATTNGHGLGDRAGRPVAMAHRAVVRGMDSRPRRNKVVRVRVATAHRRRAGRAGRVAKADTALLHRAARVDMVRRRKATPVDKAGKVVRVVRVGRVRVVTARRRRVGRVDMVRRRKAVRAVRAATIAHNRRRVDRAVRVATVPRPRHTVNRVNQANRAARMALPVPRPMMPRAPIPVRRGRVATARNRLPVPVA